MKAGIISQVLDYYFNPDQQFLFGAEVIRAMDEFFGKGKEPMNSESMGHFSEWFIFDFTLKTGETPLQYFCDKNPLKMHSGDISVLKSMQEDNIYDIFEIVRLKTGKCMTLHQIRTSKTYEVYEKTATRQLRKGDSFICRVINVGDGYEMAGGSVLPLPRFGKGAKEILSNTKDRLTPKDVYKMILGMEKAEVQEMGDGSVLVTGGLNDGPQEEYDNCAVCQLTKRCKAEGRKPTHKELMKAMEEANRNR